MKLPGTCVDTSSAPSFSSCPKYLRVCGLLWGVLWRLGTILWHIHGLSTDV